MENLAHSLAGWRIGQLPFAARVGPRAPLLALLAANLPDADVLLYLWDRDLGNWQHRGCTHSFLGWPLLTLAGAALSSRWLKTGRFVDHVALWAVAVASHALLDVPTTWGTQLLWPNDQRFGLELIFIVDPAFWVLLGGLPTWLQRRGRTVGAAAAAGLVALGAWFGVATIGKVLAMRQAPEPVIVVPAPLAPLFWTGITRPEAGDPEVRRYWLTPWSSEAAGRFGAPRGPNVEAVLATHSGERDFWMSIAPAVLVEEPAATAGGPARLGIVDLAYASWLDPDTFRFGHVYLVHPDGTVERSGDVQRR